MNFQRENIERAIAAFPALSDILSALPISEPFSLEDFQGAAQAQPQGQPERPAPAPAPAPAVSLRPNYTTLICQNGALS